MTPKPDAGDALKALDRVVASLKSVHHDTLAGINVYDKTSYAKNLEIVRAALSHDDAAPQAVDVEALKRDYCIETYDHRADMYSLPAADRAVFDFLVKRLSVFIGNTQELAKEFCAWKLPKTVCADKCACDPNYGFQRHGTNLLSMCEAKQFFDHLAAKGLLTAPEKIEAWVRTDERLPEKPNVSRYEHVDCLIFYKGEILKRPWNCEHLCWDDEDYDDHFCDPKEPTHWMPLPQPPALTEKK